MRKYLVLLLVVLFPFLSIMAEKWTPESLPMPYLRDARQHVCNPDEVLSNAVVDSLNVLLTQLERDKGVQTIVVVVKQLEGDDPYDFCMQLGRKYGIGSKKQRTGLIVLLATEDRSYQILTGNRLEGTLPDGVCRRIQNRVMVPALKRSDWNGAMLNTIKSIDSYVRGDDSLNADSDDEDEDAALVGAVLTGVLIIFGGVVFWMSRKRCPKCGKRMKKVSTSRVRHSLSNTWVYCTKWRCPKCGHTTNTYTDDVARDSSGGFPPINMGGGSLHSSGSSFGGGVFGGGTFGGGGSGGRF